MLNSIKDKKLAMILVFLAFIIVLNNFVLVGLINNADENNLRYSLREKESLVFINDKEIGDENNDILTSNRDFNKDEFFSKEDVDEVLIENANGFINYEMPDIINSIEESNEKERKKIIEFKGDKDEMISEIERILDREIEISAEYSNIMNGIAADIDDKEMSRLIGNDMILEIYPDYEVKVLLIDSIPLINADDVWNILDDNGKNMTGENISIVIIDTGVDYTLSELGGCFGPECKVVGGYDFVNNDDDPRDDHWHGTHVASIAAGNGILKGVAPDARIVAYKVLDKNGVGSDSKVISAIERAMDPNRDGNTSDHYDIISLSLGRDGNPDDVLSRAVDRAVEAGIVVVVAAGNSGPDVNTIGSPAASRKAISVGASNKNDKVASFSSRGPIIWENESGEEKILMKPDLIAPGVDICAAKSENMVNDVCLDGNHLKSSGTSMAAPFVSGAAALIKQKNPNWNVEEIKFALKNNAVDLNEAINVQGAGRINVLDSILINESPVIGKLEMEKYEVSGEINVTGRVIGDFDKYEVYISNNTECKGNECKDKLICSGTEEKEILCEGFDTNELEEGEYIIKVFVDSKNGEIDDGTIIKINNFELEKVGETLNYINGRDETYGFIKTERYDSFLIEYSKNQDDWKFACNGTMVIDKRLCKIDLNLEDGEYFFRLSLFIDGEYRRDLPIKVALINNLLSGWPFEFGCQPDAPLTFIYSDNNGKGEIMGVFSSRCGRLDSERSWYSSLKNLTLIDSYSESKNLISVESVNNAISIYNKNIFVSGFATQLSLDAEDDFRTKWSYTNYSYFAISPATIIEDKMFLIKNKNNRFYLFGYEQNGSFSEGFPFEISNEGNFSNYYSLEQLVMINDVYDKKIGVVFWGKSENAGGKLYFDIYSINGTLINRLILSNDSGKNVEYSNVNFVAMDREYDGKSEIVLTFTKVIGGNYIESKILLLDLKMQRNYELYKAINNVVENIKFVREGINENIVFILRGTLLTSISAPRVISIDMDGNQIFDFSLNDENMMIETSAVGDIDSDGESEIILAYRPRWWKGENSGLLIYDSFGSLEKEIKIPTFGQAELFKYGKEFTPILADFNGDGNLDIIQQTLFIPGKKSEPWRTHIFVFTFNWSYNANNVDWGNFAHDNQRTNCYNCQRSAPIIPFSETPSNDEPLGQGEVPYHGDSENAKP